MAEGAMSDSLSEEDEETIWARGDSCLAEWHGEYYKARIVRFEKSATGDKKAVVRFDGLVSDQNQSVDLTSLRRKRTKQNKRSTSPAKIVDVSFSIFSPKREEEEKQRLLAKFKLLEYEERLELEKQKADESWQSSRAGGSQARGPKVTSPKSQKHRTRKAVVVVGGEVKRRNSSTKTAPKSDTASPCSVTPTEANNDGPLKEMTSPKSPIPGLSISESDNDDADRSASSRAGFSDSDMEKPWFPNITPTSAKEPLVLSEPGRKPAIQVPATINQYLREYQREGIRFLYSHYKNGHGAILGDDMGLGKTVQVIGFIAAVQGKTGTKLDVMRQKPQFIRKMSDNPALYEPVCDVKPFLIIGPATVLYNWIDELAVWGHFRVGRFHKQQKGETLSELRRRKLDVVVTTFETCRDHVDALNEFEWEAVVADEAHKIKGLKTEVTKALKKLNCHKRFGLTGTPLQNRLQELWCIMDWANEKCLGRLSSFNSKFVEVIEHGQKHEATKRELAEARAAQDRLGQIRAKWLLRRTKKLIADQMPRKDELVVYCQMAELQADIYGTIMGAADMQFILAADDPCPCGSDAKKKHCCYKKTPDGKKIRQLTFIYMHLLLKTANHIALLLPSNIESTNQIAYAKAVCEKVFENHQQFVEQAKKASFRTLSDPKYCGKMKVLAGLLSVFKKQSSKVLLFSYSTRLLDILEQYIISKGFEYRRLDGSTPEAKRVQLVKEFNRDPNLFIFLVSTKAGGIGLNLTGANVVIIFDPNWNPTHDLQAQDRAYRLGQQRDVKVFRLICSGTIEENIYLRQVYKQQQANQAVDSQYSRRYFNDGELFGVQNMFRLRKSNRCLTEDILARHRKVEEGLKAFRVEEYIASPRDHEESDGEADYTENDDVMDDGIQKGMAEIMGEKRASGSKVNVVNGKAYTVPTRARRKEDAEGGGQQEGDGKTVDENQGAVEEDFHNSQVASTSKGVAWSTKAGKRKSNGVAKTATGKGRTQDNDLTQSDSNLDSDDSSVSGGTRGDKRTKHSARPAKSKKDHSKFLKNKNKRDEASSKACNHYTKIRNRVEFCKANDREVSDSDSNLPSTTKKQKMSSGSKVPPPQTLASYQSVTDVLEDCGVVHLHENRRIVGDSRAEEHISRAAMRDVFDLHQYSQMPAMNCEPFSQSSDESDNIDAVLQEQQLKKRTSLERAKTSSRPWSELLGHRKILGGQTPKTIQRQHFKAMAVANASSELDLARKVIFAAQEERLELLRNFYSGQDSALNPVLMKKLQPLNADKEKKRRENSGKKTTLVRSSKTVDSRTVEKRGRRTRVKKGVEYSDERGQGVVRSHDAHSGGASRPIARDRPFISHQNKQVSRELRDTVDDTSREVEKHGSPELPNEPTVNSKAGEMSQVAVNRSDDLFIVFETNDKANSDASNQEQITHKGTMSSGDYKKRAKKYRVDLACNPTFNEGFRSSSGASIKHHDTGSKIGQIQELGENREASQLAGKKASNNKAIKNTLEFLDDVFFSD